MFYIQYIKIKDDAERTKQFALLISSTLALGLMYFRSSDLINFITGKPLDITGYLVIVILIYLLTNIYVAYQLDDTSTNKEVAKSNSKSNDNTVSESKTNKPQNEKKSINNQKPNYNELIFYDLNNERPSVIPDFGNDGLEEPDAVDSGYSYDYNEQTENKNIDDADSDDGVGESEFNQMNNFSFENEHNETEEFEEKESETEEKDTENPTNSNNEIDTEEEERKRKQDRLKEFLNKKNT